MERKTEMDISKLKGERTMERLTSYDSKCKREMICRYEDCDADEEHCPHLNEDNCPCLQEILERLAKYEDLEEQGKLLKLRCNVGDTIYGINVPTIDDTGKPIIGDIVPDIIESVIITRKGEIEYHTKHGYFKDCRIGKGVFLTRQEAERMKG